MATLRKAGVKVQHYLHLRNLTCSERTAPGQCPSPGHGNGGDCCRVYVYSTTTRWAPLAPYLILPISLVLLGLPW